MECYYTATETIRIKNGHIVDPAQRLGLTNKGNLRPGSDADITVFDLNRVRDNATFDDGQIPSEGFSWVIIGGRIALENDKIVNARLGRTVRR